MHASAHNYTAMFMLQDLDGKYRVERVHRVELPTSSLGVQGDAPVIEESDEDETVLLMPQTQILKFFEHRHLRCVTRCT